MIRGKRMTLKYVDGPNDGEKINMVVHLGTVGVTVVFYDPVQGAESHWYEMVRPKGEKPFLYYAGISIYE